MDSHKAELKGTQDTNVITETSRTQTDCLCSLYLEELGKATRLRALCVKTRKSRENCQEDEHLSGDRRNTSWEFLKSYES